MLFSIKRGARMLAVAAGALAVAASPAHAKGALANPYDCAPGGALAQSFAGFGDTALYTPVQNPGLEAGAAGWTLSGGAAVVSGNEPWHLGGAADHSSLSLPAGATAITAPICIDPTYPYFRLFARGAAGQSLKVEVLAYDTKGRLLKTTPFSYTPSGSAWAPTPSIAIDTFAYNKADVSAAPVAFAFTAGKAGFAIDDVYVDPWARH